MIELITKKEFEDFFEIQDRISELVKIKTAELALIKYGRLPNGESIDFDIYECEHESGCMFVDYETYCCGELEHDSYYLPFEFIYDEIAPQRYKESFEERKHLLKEIEKQAEKERLERTRIGLENYEREQLKKLKEKYE